jgi:chemotaxis protein CheY-P-specific phosphatase CheC
LSTPIVICDDSSFARKQLASALPDDCDVEITFASNGQEGLSALKDKKIDIMFLDLNMPGLDGYQTLEAMREHGLKTKVVVVSGDIQPDAQKRVKGLGAVAFIKKPVDKNEIAGLLKKHGIKTSKAKTGKRFEIETDVQVGCQEIANIAMGRAVDLLSRLLNVYINMPIPRVNTIEKNELLMALKYVDQASDVSAVCQGFIGAGIAGEALMIFEDSSFADMAELMAYRELPDESMQLELLMDVSSILFSAFLKGMAEQLDIQFCQSQPIVLGQHMKVSDLMSRNEIRWEKTLAIETSFTFDDRNISCDLLFLFTEDSIDPIYQLVEYLLPE